MAVLILDRNPERLNAVLMTENRTIDAKDISKDMFFALQDLGVKIEFC